MIGMKVMRLLSTFALSQSTMFSRLNTKGGDTMGKPHYIRFRQDVILKVKNCVDTLEAFELVDYYAKQSLPQGRDCYIEQVDEYTITEVNEEDVRAK